MKKITLYHVNSDKDRNKQQQKIQEAKVQTERLYVSEGTETISLHLDLNIMEGDQ